jgi:hypothetical protein
MINNLTIQEKIKIINNRINNITLSIKDANECLNREQSQEYPNLDILEGYYKYLSNAEIKISALNKELSLLTQNQ